MDRTTKILMMVVAAGLWTNIGVSLLRPSSAKADAEQYPGRIYNSVAAIANGACTNRKIC
jgi:hypothetical protein